MNRRDFLTFRVERRVRVAELSCERLYMRLLDSQVTGEPSGEGAAEGWCGGEPAAVYHRSSVQEVFDQIDRDLNGIDLLRITDREWLTDHPYLEGVISQFRARGGRVDIAP